MKTLKKQMKTVLLSIALIIGANAYAQNKSNKIKDYKIWVILTNGTQFRSVLYSADKEGIVIKKKSSTDSLDLATINAENISSIKFRRKNSIGRGALIGGLSGVAVGAIAGFASGDDEAGWFAFSAEEKAAAGAAVLGTLGAGLGALVGTSKKKITINGDIKNYERQLELIQSYSLRRNTN